MECLDAHSLQLQAYKKPAGRAQAHQIIQSFAVMQPSGDSGDSSSEDDDDDDDYDDDDDDRDQDESSVGSAEAEERAYLRQVQRSTPIMNRRPMPPPQQQKARWQHEQRPSSRASSQSGRMSMMTAPSELRRLSISSSNNSTTLRPVSAASARSGFGMSKRDGVQQRTAKRELYEDNFDDSVNPWVLHPSSRQYRMEPVPSMQQRESPQDLSALYRSPMSTTSSSATATQQQYVSLSSQQQHEQTVLGPATKRALEALQQEIEALNERINGLRKELVARDSASSASKRLVKSSTAASNGDEDGWKWVYKVKNDDNEIKEEEERMLNSIK